MHYIKEGTLCGEKLQTPDGGISYCVWYPFNTERVEEEGFGLCFDIEERDIDDLIKLLERLKEEEPVELHRGDD